VDYGFWVGGETGEEEGEGEEEEEEGGERKCARASWVVRMGCVRLMSREA